MGNGDRTFREAYLAGEVNLEQVDDWVDRWHSTPGHTSLDRYLGFTGTEGAQWAEDPGSLRHIAHNWER